MIKRIMLLAGMAMALVAFAAPAVAQGEAYWTHTNEEGQSQTVGYGPGNGTLVEAESTIASFYGGATFRTTIFLTGEVWNNAESEMGEGVITEKVTTGLGEFVGVPPAFCSVTVQFNEGNWPLTLTADPSSQDTIDATLDIANFTFRNTHSHGCMTVFAPPALRVTGTATLTAETNTSGGAHDVALSFESTQDLYLYNPPTGEHITSPGPYVPTSNGPITLTGENGTSLGVEQHP